MHTLQIVQHQQAKYQEQAEKLNRKAIALRRKNQSVEAQKYEAVAREYMFKSAALLWVLNEEPTIFPSPAVMASAQSS